MLSSGKGKYVNNWTSMQELKIGLDVTWIYGQKELFHCRMKYVHSLSTGTRPMILFILPIVLRINGLQGKMTCTTLATLCKNYLVCIIDGRQPLSMVTISFSFYFERNQSSYSNRLLCLVKEYLREVRDGRALLLLLKVHLDKPNVHDRLEILGTLLCRIHTVPWK